MGSCPNVPGVWYVVSQNDKNLKEELKSQRDSITNALESLVYSRCSGVSYAELDAVCAYLKWNMEYTRFEEDKARDRDTMQAEKDAALALARLQFRQKNGRLLERFVWEWCPLYRVLVAACLLNALPPMPWVHNSE